jgi:hypothetical protein
MGFLRKAGNYNLQEALAICDKRQLYRETVFLYGMNLIFIHKKEYFEYIYNRTSGKWTCCFTNNS